MQISNVEFDSTWNYALHMMAFLAAVLVIVVLLMNLLFRIPLWMSNRRLKK
ncbi:ABC-type phosphate transport system permease subunit [Paenibacillus rhizosphaerae]|uniref:ABC-type phosphate transport system permease subunit n=1 Tax=Paenibacillus rhizosphaerae TaxID=297318 RepID=A0A839TYQ9_9BACL|nr:ABC-type phosphate transport system permease subunit [Paenibacillus rhizosphaerae]